MVFLFSIILIITLIIFSTIKIQLINFKFSSNKNEGRHINKDYNIIISLKILGSIPIFKSKITKEKLDNVDIKEKIDKINIDFTKRTNIVFKDLINNAKKLNIKIQDLYLKIELGTENAALTSVIVPIVSTFIAIFLKNKVKEFEEQSFLITPIYNNTNILNINLSGIFYFKTFEILKTLISINRKDIKIHEKDKEQYNEIAFKNI